MKKFSNNRNRQNQLKFPPKYLMLFGLMIILHPALSQQINKRGLFADSVFVYKSFDKGGSTASLRYYSKAVDTIKNIKKVQLGHAYLDTLNFLITKIKSKRHFQQKIGRSFYGIIFKDGQESRIGIVAGWAIIDLKTNRQYVFKDTPYFEMYTRLVESNCR